MKNKNVILSLVFVGITILSVFFFDELQKDHVRMLNEQKQLIENLENEISKINKENEEKRLKALSEVSDLNEDRYGRDKSLVEDFLKLAFTWDSYDEYMKARRDLMTEYELSSDSDFLKVFMPPITNKKIGEKNYNRIDLEGLNMTYDKFIPCLCDISDEGVYSYFTLITIKSSSGKYDASSDACLSYDIDKDGKISNIKAHLITK